jgi:hypothetical protein
VEENSNRSEIKHTFQKKMDSYYPSSSFQKVWNTAHSKRGKRSLKKPLLSIAVVAALTVTLFLTPSVKAVFEGLFEFTKVEQNEEVSIGGSWSIAGDESKVYTSLSEVEKMYDMDIPFPQKLMSAEKGAEHEYSVSTENGQFLAYDYKLWTEERWYSVAASNVVKEKPKFTANTDKKTVIDKEIFINGVPARLLGIHDLNGYHIYIEKGNWSMIISGFARTSNEKSEITKVSEEEMIDIAETINW